MKASFKKLTVLTSLVFCSTAALARAENINLIQAGDLLCIERYGSSIDSGASLGKYGSVPATILLKSATLTEEQKKIVAEFTMIDSVEFDSCETVKSLVEDAWQNFSMLYIKTDVTERRTQDSVNKNCENVTQKVVVNILNPGLNADLNPARMILQAVQVRHTCKN